MSEITKGEPLRGQQSKRVLPPFPALPQRFAFFIGDDMEKFEAVSFFDEDGVELMIGQMADGLIRITMGSPDGASMCISFTVSREEAGQVARTMDELLHVR